MKGKIKSIVTVIATDKLFRHLRAGPGDLVGIRKRKKVSVFDAGLDPRVIRWVRIHEDDGNLSFRANSELVEEERGNPGNGLLHSVRNDGYTNPFYEA